VKSSDQIVRRIERLTGSSAAGSSRVHALLELGGAASILSETDFWMRIFALLEDEFGFALASVYLQDEEGQFTRRSPLGMSTGVTTRLERALLPPLVGAALTLRTPIFVDSASKADQRKLIAAPAQKGVALPMLIERRFFGILEATSDEGASLNASERQWLVLLGEQIARWYAAIENTQRLEARLAETNATLKRLTTQLQIRENQALATLKTEWDSYLKRRGRVVGFDLEVGAEETLLRADDLPDELRAVMERGQTAVETRDDQQTLSVPIIVRGTLLGAMAFTLPPNRRMTERQTELARGVAERLGTALENTRLFEQSRTLAQRERQANESAARLQGIVDVEALIKLAASDFREVLGAVYTRVSINLDGAAQQTPQEAT
jgi:GAF domain-containing protein